MIAPGLMMLLRVQYRVPQSGDQLVVALDGSNTINFVSSWSTAAECFLYRLQVIGVDPKNVPLCTSPKLLHRPSGASVKPVPPASVTTIPSGPWFMEYVENRPFLSTPAKDPVRAAAQPSIRTRPTST